MKVTNLLEKFFKGLTVLETIESRFNGIIKIDEDLFGHKRLMVGNLAQSGGDVEKIWKATIGKLAGYKIENCLILGLGAGNAAKVVNKYFSKAKITGIEIDPEMINLGNKYFGLKEIRNLKIEIENAFDWVDNCINGLIHCNSRFDLIMVDLYFGDCFPEKAEGNNFLENLKKITKKEGIVIFNHLFYGKNIEKTDKFEQKIRKVFTQIEAKKINYNKIFLCRK